MPKPDECFRPRLVKHAMQVKLKLLARGQQVHLAQQCTHPPHGLATHLITALIHSPSFNFLLREVAQLVWRDTCTACHGFRTLQDVNRVAAVVSVCVYLCWDSSLDTASGGGWSGECLPLSLINTRLSSIHQTMIVSVTRRVTSCLSFSLTRALGWLIAPRSFHPFGAQTWHLVCKSNQTTATV